MAISIAACADLAKAGWTATKEPPALSRLAVEIYKTLGGPKHYLTEFQKRGWWVCDDMALAAKATSDPAAFGFQFFDTPEDAMASAWIAVKGKA